nr:hypothetical protein CFP56_43742 [Quercus suber]
MRVLPYGRAAFLTTSIARRKVPRVPITLFLRCPNRINALTKRNDKSSTSPTVCTTRTLPAPRCKTRRVISLSIALVPCAGENVNRGSPGCPQPSARGAWLEKKRHRRQRFHKSRTAV